MVDKDFSLKATDKPSVYTVGHSNHSLEDFIKILETNHVTAIGDVRSIPYSKYNSHFDRENLKGELTKLGIAYSFLGNELGARPKDINCYNGNRADYNLISNSNNFKVGLSRVIKGAKRYKIALMCAEKEPLDCHRTILIARSLKKLDIPIHHILYDGSIEGHDSTEKRSVMLTKQEMDDLFSDQGSEQDPVERAYSIRALEIAYQETINPEFNTT